MNYQRRRFRSLYVIGSGGAKATWWGGTKSNQPVGCRVIVRAKEGTVHATNEPYQLK
ncbi:MAG TPA: hypothetical protein VFV83_03275 [Chthoniobacteraceae bacterium]|nr:hypothetical protein [Chthoniobacteraceae bacterium]